MTRPPDHIVKVTVRSPGAVAGHGRRLRAALGHARLHPPSLPPSAVLVVRRLDGLAGLGSDTRLSPAWERDARRALDAGARGAVRPRHGRVPEAADAVVFADEAELMACAAVAHGQRPWWAVGARSVGQRLAERPRMAPAVLDLLVRWNEAPRVLADLRPEDARRLLGEIGDAFGLPLDEVVPQPTATSPSGSFPLNRLGSLPQAAPVPWAEMPWAGMPDLATAVRELERRVGRAQATLLGISVLLARAPHRLRTPEARAAIRTWQDRPFAPPPLPSPRESPEESPAGPPEDRRPSPPLPSAPVRSDRDPPDPEPAAPLRPDARHAKARRETLPAAEPGRSSERDAWAAGTATALGGVLFLLPVMRALGLPDTAEADWRLASAVGAWGVLEALARGLLGDAHNGHATDPLWPALARLDGRSLDEPPRDAHPPRSVYRPLPGGPPPPLHGLAALPHALAAWTRLVLPTVQVRLVDALGLAGAHEIPDALLLRDGTLHTTTSHVDLVLPLSSVRLNVRRAGLDADPGWMPAFGRVVQFHYHSP